jgi:hypothetical protein
LIRTATTFVVGAGASCDYGLPTGSQLKTMAWSLDSKSDVIRLATIALLKHKIGGEKVLQFREDLKQYPEDSIDAFLEKRRTRPNMVQIGKTLMAALIGDTLTKAQQVEADKDWLLHLVKKMLSDAGANFDNFINGNNVKFVTFNFDAFIETRLPQLIRRAYPEADMRRVSEAFPVIHVHGKLSPIPAKPMKVDEYFGKHQEWVEWINDGAQNINVTSDAIPRDVLEVAESRRSSGLGFSAFSGFLTTEQTWRALDCHRC